MSRSSEHVDVTYLVAYDGGAGSERALQRATAFADQRDARLVVASVLPTDPALAETYDLHEGGEYDPDAAAERLRASAAEVAPAAEFRAERVDVYAGKRRIAKELSRVAVEEDADVVFVAVDDTGRVVQQLSAVDAVDTESGGDNGYDLFVVRSA